jgi:biopolymer transport protein ExbD
VANWDVFHADRLELERRRDASSIRLALARGELREDDLVRPAGTSLPWIRLDDVPELRAAPESGAVAEGVPAAPAGSQTPAERPSDFEEVQPGLEDIIPPPPTRHPTEPSGPWSSSDVTIPVLDESDRSFGPKAPPENRVWEWDEDEEEDEDEGDEEALEDAADPEVPDDGPKELPRKTAPAVATHFPRDRGWEPGALDLDLKDRPDSRSSHVALPVVRTGDRDHVEAAGDAEEKETEDTFSLARSATTTVEELDLAPMVDVAFNLVLFFMVTASTILYKTLEIPKPSGEAPSGAVAQGRSRTMDDLKSDYILVEIDEQGAMKLDREPVEATMDNLVELLRRAREKTGRKAMLLSADFATPHRNAVLAYDAANEIGLGIAIARPQAPLGPAPALRPGAAPRPSKETAANRPS